MDLVSTDHYLGAHDPEAHIDLAFAADITRGLAGGAPWLLMEHSTGAVNWQPRNIPKTPGQMRRNSLAHVARGSDGALFFQWRASRAGAEKYHSALLPHAGVDSRVWREVCELGADLRRLEEVEGSRVGADVAIVFDWQSVWAQEQPGHPSVDMTVRDELATWHRALWKLGVTVDFLPAHGDFSSYPLLLLPSLYVLGETDRAALDFYVEGGGTLVVGAYSGVVDENDAVWTGGYPGALRDLLGVRMEEFVPLGEGRTVTLSDGSTGGVWRELGRTTTAEVIASYTDDGFHPGGSGAGVSPAADPRAASPTATPPRAAGTTPGPGTWRGRPPSPATSTVPARPGTSPPGWTTPPCGACSPGSPPRRASPPRLPAWSSYGGATPTAPPTCSRSITTTRRTSSWPSPAPTCSPRRTSPVRCRRAASP